MTNRTLAQNSSALIIEDDPKLARIFAEALKMSTFEYQIIHHGHKALEYLVNAVPALIILDIHLPYMSGSDILQEIQNDPRLANTLVIVVTADLFAAEELRSRADRVLMKPISFYRLYGVIEDLRAASPVGA